MTFRYSEIAPANVSSVATWGGSSKEPRALLVLHVPGLTLLGADR